MTAWLQHASSVTARALSWLPGWAVLLVLAGLAAALAALAMRARRRAAGLDPDVEADLDADAEADLGSDTDEITAASVPAGRPREGSQS
jgi:hypothetical protein